MKKIVTWVVIADGGHARIVANDGPGKGLHDVPGAQWEGDQRQTGEIMADRQGRSFESVGEMRHGMEPQSDPRQLVEDAFLNGIVGYLAEHEQKGRYDRLVIAAEPRALGTLRRSLTPALQRRLHADLPKDLTKVRTDQLAGHLGAVMPV
ncbi:MAG: host attachment protein [Alphaproteobacteria bacterium]